MRRALWILGGLALAAVLVIGIVQAGGDETEIPTTSTVAGAEDPLIKGDVTTYEAQLKASRGRPVVVNAWASWCGPCKLEMPIFAKVASDLEGRVDFLGLNVSDNREAALAFLKTSPVPYESIEDGDARIIQKAGGSGGLPATIFYDAEGERAFIHQGQYTSEKDLLEDIERYAGA